MGSPVGQLILEIVQNVISQVKEEQSILSVNITERHQDDVSKSYLFILSYKGKEGKTLCNVSKEVNKILPNNQKTMLVYTGATVSDR